MESLLPLAPPGVWAGIRLAVHCENLFFAAATLSSVDGSAGTMGAAEAESDLSITPAFGFSSRQISGGKFEPASKDFTLTNSGTTPVVWKASKTQSWTALSSQGGTLGPGATAIITWSLDPAVVGLSPGEFADTLTIVNQSQAGEQSRDLFLTMEPRLIPVMIQPLDADPGWHRNGQWGFGRPLGAGGSLSTGGLGPADPIAGATGTNVFGINLAGNYTGDASIDYLVAGPFDLRGLEAPAIRFKCWLNSDFILTTQSVEVSVDGNTWSPVVNLSINGSESWGTETWSLRESAVNQPEVFVRWGHRTTGTDRLFSGWNIDDIEILAHTRRPDLAATPQALVTPANTPIAFTLTGEATTPQDLQFAILTQPKSGTLSGTVPDLTYTPAPDFVGSDAVSFTVSSGGDTSIPAMIGFVVSGRPRLTLDVVSGASLAAEGSALTFAPTTVGMVKTCRLKISNVGNAYLNLKSMSLDGGNAAEFDVTLPTALSLKPGASAYFEISAAPLTAATKTATLHLLTDDPEKEAHEIALSATAAVPGAEIQLIRDVNAHGSSLVSSTAMVAMEGVTFFVGTTASTGSELWRTDGTAAGTFMVRDIAAGPGGSGISSLVRLGDRVYFGANDATNGLELWASDGSPEGTVLVRDINTGVGSSSPVALSSVGNMLYFTATDGTAGSELWKSDGTGNGTVMVADIHPGAGASSPSRVIPCGGHLYFAATNGADGVELWKTDGTAAGTAMVKDVAQGAGSSTPATLTAWNNVLFFSASDGGNGTELWRSDGTVPGTQMVLDINPGGPSSSPISMAVIGDGILFRATTGNEGSELWRTDGSAVGTVLVKDILTGPSSGVTSLPTAIEGTFYFAAGDFDTGSELWRSDGTEAGTYNIRDLVPGSVSSTPRNFRLCDGSIYFTATTELGTELWITNGTQAGTHVVKDIFPGHRSSEPSQLTDFGGLLLFAADDGLAGRELWVSGGDAASTFPIGDLAAGSASTTYANFCAINDALYFSAAVPKTGAEPWRSTGLTAGSAMVADVFAGTTPSSPSGFVALGSQVLFAANGSQLGTELYRTDGTEAGTTLVRDIMNGTVGSNPASLCVIENVAYFSAMSSTSLGTELWRTNGTSAGTLMLKNINPNNNGSSNPGNFIGIGNGSFLFTANDGVNGAELWKSDGTGSGTTLLKDLNAGGAGSAAANFTRMNGLTYFTATTAAAGTELWRSDGTSEGTLQVADINPGVGSSSPQTLTVVGNTLFFSAFTETSGRELWKWDGSSTSMVKDIGFSADSANPSGLAEFHGRLCFSATDGVLHGYELWMSDGTSEGTSMIKDIRAGPESSFPADLVNVNGTLYFRASTELHGSELWRSDGTDWGTGLVQDLYTGSASSMPTNLNRVGTSLIFTAISPAVGNELFRLNAPPPASITFELQDGTPLLAGSALVDFGAVDVSSSSEKTIVIKNAGGLPLLIQGLYIDGADTESFNASQASGTIIPADCSATFTLAFRPTSNGSKAAALHVYSNDFDTSPFDIVLHGSGINEPDIQVEQPLGTVLTSGDSVAEFGPVDLAESATMIFTVKNANPGTILRLGALTVSGPSSDSFLFETNKLATAVFDSGSTTISVTFRPLSAGAHMATLLIPSNDPHEKQFSIRLAGTGRPLPGPSQIIGGSTQAPIRFASNGTFIMPFVATSGLPLEFEVLAGHDVGQLSGNAFTPSGVEGSVTLRISQPGDSSYSTAPPIVRTILVGSSPFVQLARGSSAQHSGGIQADGSLWLWGRNDNGQLGNGSNDADSHRPLRVGSDRDWLRVAVGTSHTLAIKFSGTLWAWGSNSDGEMGNGSMVRAFAPVQIGSDTNWAGVAAGNRFSLGVRTDGSLWAWGKNSSRQLGDGTDVSRDMPVQIGTGIKWSNVAAGEAHVLALTTDGHLWVWGLGTSGQLGLGDSESRELPTPLGSQIWSQIAASSGSSYGIRSDGTLWAWGANGSGNLGNGTTLPAEAPIQIGAANDWKSVSAGPYHAAAVRSDGSLWTWGAASSGRTGQGGTIGKLIPTRVGFDNDWIMAACGRQHLLGLKGDGTIWAAGNNRYGQLAYPVGSPSPLATGGILAFSGGTYGTHFIRRDGTLWGVGLNYFGELGDGTSTPRSQPKQIGAESNWRQVARNFNHTVALKTDGTLWACGSNANGALGDGSFAYQKQFVQIGSETAWSEIATGSGFTGARKFDGSIWTWGFNGSGQLGHGDNLNRMTPAQVGAATNWATIACGLHHMAAIKKDGSMWCWGANPRGELGVGDQVARNVPTRVGGTTDWDKVACGFQHTLALKKDGSLWAWGNNTSNELGDGTVVHRTSPVTIGTSKDWVDIFAGHSHSMAIKANGELWIWGDGDQGIFFDSLITRASVPTLSDSGKAWTQLPKGAIDFSLAATAEGTLWGGGPNADMQFTDSNRVNSRLAYAYPAISSQIVLVPPVIITSYGVPIKINGTATSGLPVSYSVSGPAIVNQGELTVTGPGEVKLLAWQPGEQPTWHSSPLVQVSVLTPPAANTLAASSITAFAATLNATVTGDDGTVAVFEYDTDITDGVYDFSTDPEPIPSPSSFSTEVTNLRRGTLYHFRVKATNAQGTTEGEDRVFITLNTAPVATPGTVNGSEDCALPVAVNGTDAEHDTLVYSVISAPRNGSLMGTAPLFTYLPDADFNGTDSFTFIASDGLLDSQPELVTINIGPVNDAPLASDASNSGSEDVVVRGNLVATDVDQGDVLTFVKHAGPVHGTVTVDPATGAYTYTPSPNSNGNDSFTFRVSDGNADSNVAMISLTIHAVNDLPVVSDRSAKGVQGNLLRGWVTGTDIENQPLAFVLVAGAANGAATVNADGTFSYRPNAGFVGTDTFTFKASDGLSDSNLGTVHVVITTSLPEWAWMNGPDKANQSGVYTGVAAPGARHGTSRWTDAAGNFWLFGGSGYGKSTGPGLLNDLWKFDATSSSWTLIAGAEEVNGAAAYGTQGIGAAGNSPGPRRGAVSWIDGAGDLWLFGGNGRDSVGTTGTLNDLWKFNPQTQVWTWMKGANLANSNGTFGSQGTPAAGNSPSARAGAVAWLDDTGGLWLFGGRGLPGSGTKVGSLNDLWRYDPAANQWAWLKGSNTLDAAGVFGTQGVATAATSPGARTDAAGWTDAFGNFWLFGGAGFAQAGAAGNLSDLWKYDPSMNQWTWVRGAAVVNSAGIYGGLGIPAPGSQPGARNGAMTWTDATGALWLFGGTGHAASGSGLLSDVWRYDPAANLWTWMKGASATNGAANYGSLGVAAPANTPSARRAGACFADQQGDLWLFGGLNGTNHFSDLWRLDLPPAPVVRLLPQELALRAGVEANGLAATAFFRYSPNRDLSEAVMTPIESFGSGGGELTAELTGLPASTTYYYQAIATNAFGTGISRLGSFTTPGAPIIPSAGFAEAAINSDEGAGTVSLVVKLDAPSAAAFTIPFTLAGSATAGSAADYIVSASPLSFVAGQTLATIAIPLRDDVLDEADETIIVTLGTPSGGVTLGAVTQCTLTITDNDAAIEIVTPPQSQFAAIGEDTVLTVEATGSGALSYQWKRNGTAIKGATTASHVITGTPLTANGDYTVEIKNPVGMLASPAAELNVIDVTGRTLAIAPNGTATLSVSAAGPGTLEYLWFVDDEPMLPTIGDTRITGISGKTLTIKKLTTADAGKYTCRVRRPGTSLEAFGGANNLAVVTLKPIVLPIDTLPVGVIGGTYEFQIPIDPDPARVPSGFAVTGLTKGLGVNATGLISGRPTAAVTGKAIAITAKNSAGTSTAEPCTLTVLPLPATVTGVYLAQVARHEAINGGHGARIDLTTTGAGSFSARLTLVGSNLSASKGLVATTLDTSNPSPAVVSTSGSILIPRKNQSNLELAFTLDDPANTLAGTLTDTATGQSAAVSGHRNPWHATANKATAYAGYYTLGLEIPADRVGDQSIPQGNGFGSFTAKDNGTLALAGQTADGQGFSSAGFVSAGGSVAVFAPFTTIPGSLLGVPVITGNALAGELSWSKAAAAATSKSRAYRGGFGLLPLTVIGGRYAPPAAGQVVMGLANSANNARLVFAEGGLQPGQCPPLTVSIRNTNPKGATQTITLPAANPNKISFTLAATPAGQFSGKFTIPNPVSSLVRTIGYQGIIVRNGDGLESMGYFMLPMLPQPGETLKTSPELSGQAVLMPVVEP